MNYCSKTIVLTSTVTVQIISTQIFISCLTIGKQMKIPNMNQAYQGTEAYEIF